MFFKCFTEIVECMYVCREDEARQMEKITKDGHPHISTIWSGTGFHVFHDVYYTMSSTMYTVVDL